MSSKQGRGPGLTARLLLATGLVLTLWATLIGALAWYSGHGLPTGEGEPLSAAPDEWTAALGQLDYQQEIPVLSQFGDSGEALLIWRPRAFDASEFDILTVELDQFPFNYVLMLAWKASVDASSQFTRLQVPQGSTQSYFLPRLTQWQGPVSEMALYLYPQPQTSPPQNLQQGIEIRTLRLAPDSWSGRIAAMLTAWRAADPWEMISPSSLGAYPDIKQGVRLTPVVFLMLLLALPIYGLALATTGWRQWLGLTGYGVLVGVLVIQAHWMYSLAGQVAATARLHAQTAQAPPSARLYDQQLVQLVQAALQALPAVGTARVFVAADARFFRLRAGWHLRPHNVFTFFPGEDLRGADKVRPGDYLFIYRRPDLLAEASNGQLTLGKQMLNVSVQLQTASGGLVRFEASP